MRRFLAIRLLLMGLIPVGAAIAAASAGVWLDVPFVKQDKNGCGPASIAMVIEYWDHHGNPIAGDEAQPAAIERVVYSREAKGALGSSMKRYFEQAGFRAFLFRGEWSDLGEHLAKGRPLIVCLRRARSSHYVVVSGLDDRQGVVLVNDPARRKLLKLERAGFEKDWNAADNWTLLALPGPQQ